MNYKYIYLWASIILFLGLMRLIHYLINSGIIQEGFSKKSNKQSKSNTKPKPMPSQIPTPPPRINMPLTSTISCSNMCINARCSKTGQQCLSDIDCPGCQEIKLKKLYNTNSNIQSKNISGKLSNVQSNNSAGKLTTAISPNYSTLTTDIGTFSKVYNSHAKYTPKANFGENIWINTYNTENELFNKRYKPSGLHFMPKYPKKYSITGTFLDDGPLASNA